MKNLIAAILLSFLAVNICADDFQCTSDTGCTALLPSPSGTRTVKFKKGDIIGTSGGWIVNPADGWTRVDFSPYLMPHLNPDQYVITSISGDEINYVEVLEIN